MLNIHTLPVPILRCLLHVERFWTLASGRIRPSGVFRLRSHKIRRRASRESCSLLCCVGIRSTRHVIVGRSVTWTAATRKSAGLNFRCSKSGHHLHEVLRPNSGVASLESCLCRPVTLQQGCPKFKDSFECSQRMQPSFPQFVACSRWILRGPA